MTNFNYDATVPAANNNPSEDQPDMQTNFQSIKDLIAVDHVTFEANNGGQHTSISFNQDASFVPVPPVSPPELFTNTVNGQPQLFYYTGDADHSSNQYTNSASNGSTFLLGGVIIKWGTASLTGSDSTVNTNFATAFPNNLYQVVITPNSQEEVIKYTGGTRFLFTAENHNTGTRNFSWFAIGN